MNGIKKIQELNNQELENNISEAGSWHTQYKDSSYIYIGGLPFELKEEDIITIFSQYGVPTDIKLVRDKETNESKGFCFLAYEDQRSTVLLVDNLNGIKLLDRMIKVDHCHYRPFSSDDPLEMEKERKYKEEMQKLLQPDREVEQVDETKTIELNATPAQDPDEDFIDPMALFVGKKKHKKERKRELSPSPNREVSYKSERK